MLQSNNFGKLKNVDENSGFGISGKDSSQKIQICTCSKISTRSYCRGKNGPYAIEKLEVGCAAAESHHTPVG